MSQWEVGAVGVGIESEEEEEEAEEEEEEEEEEAEEEEEDSCRLSECSVNLSSLQNLSLSRLAIAASIAAQILQYHFLVTAPL